MLRLGLRSLLLALVLSAIGFVSLESVWFEVFRVAGGVFLTVGVVLLLVNYVVTPEPPPR
jgi:hypothetical protein